MNSKVRILAALISSLVIVPFALSCGGSSNSDLETSLRSQLSATQAQLDQAQELITNLQDQIESLENTIQTPIPDTPAASRSYFSPLMRCDSHPLPTDLTLRDR